MKCQQLGEYTERIDRSWIMRAASESALHLVLRVRVAFYRLIVRLKQLLGAFPCENVPSLPFEQSVLVRYSDCPRSSAGLLAGCRMRSAAP